MTCAKCPSEAVQPGKGDITAALAGNPNCGKTTLFNNLTGAHQRVGNWPGVTVDRKEGRYRDDEGEISIIDLPGVYTLGVVPGAEGESLDETLARDFIVSGGADVLINVVNAANLERNLYLTAQLTEMHVPMLVVLNMMDAASNAGLEVDPQALSERLGVPVIAMSAVKNNRTADLVKAIRTLAHSGQRPAARPHYRPEVEALIGGIADGFAARPEIMDGIAADPRWLAVRLVEGDDLACRLVGADQCAALADRISALEAECGEDADILIADGRFTFAHQAAQASIARTFEARRSTSDLLDRIVLNRFAGPVIFLGLIYLMFMFTINLGGAFIDFFDQTARALFVDTVHRFFYLAGLPQWLSVILADGVGGGIEIVATFIPIIGFLYLFLSVLEDSGYMTRAAFLMDRLMRMVGLPGKAFVPLIVGFGCNVPAIMASRTLERENDRILTTVMSPFMSCGARLTIYALFTAAFFPTGGQNIVFLLYLIGILAALATGLLLKKTALKGEITPFIMELPPYRLPRLRDLFLLSWVRLKSFVFGAGRIIVMVVVVLSFLSSVGTDGTFGNENTGNSVLSSIGRAITPVFAPIGMRKENWPAAVGLFTGIFAKEAVVGTLDSLYSASDNTKGVAKGSQPLDLPGKLAAAVATIPQNMAGLATAITDPLGLTAAGPQKSLAEAAAAQQVKAGTFGAMVSRFDGRIGAFAYLLFILLYFPCLAALSAVANEAGRKWAAFAGLWSTSLAYFVSVSFYQSATFFRHPLSSAGWIGLVVILMSGFVWAMKKANNQSAAAHGALSVAE